MHTKIGNPLDKTKFKEVLKIYNFANKFHESDSLIIIMVDQLITTKVFSYRDDSKEKSIITFLFLLIRGNVKLSNVNENSVGAPAK